MIDLDIPALPIFLSGGCKGGVGKSALCEALVNDLLQRGWPVLLVETDISVPDVWRAYGNIPGVAAMTLDLDDVDGWIALGTALSQHPRHVVAINTAARNDRGIVRYGSMLTKALAKLRRPLITLWVINRQRDSLELLEDYLRLQHCYAEAMGAPGYGRGFAVSLHEGRLAQPLRRAQPTTYFVCSIADLFNPAVSAPNALAPVSASQRARASRVANAGLTGVPSVVSYIR